MLPGNLSLRARLLLLVLLAVTPAFGLIGYSAWEKRAAAELESRHNAQSLAGLIAAEQRRLVEDTRHMLSLLSDIPYVTAPELLPRCGQSLPRILKKNPRYANIGMVDADGNLLCSALPFAPPVSFADRAWFRRAVASRNFAAGDYLVGRLTKVPSLGLAYPVQDDGGRLLRVLYATIDLAWLQDYVGHLSMPDGSAVAIVDAQGTILARIPDPGHQWMGRPAPEKGKLASIVSAGCRGFAEFPGQDGVLRLNAIEPLQHVDGGCVYVRVGIPSAGIYGSVERDFQRELATMLAISLVILAAAWFGSDWIVLRRVRALAAATKRLASGELTTRTGLPHTPEELGQLARSFDDMAAGLQEREERLANQDRALARANRALTVLSGGNRAMLRARDEQSLLDEMCRVIVHTGGYAMAWVGYAQQDEARSIHPVAHAGFDAGHLDPCCRTWAEAGSGASPVGAAVRQGMPQLFRAGSGAPPPSCMSETACASTLSLPLAGDGGTDGVLGVLTISAAEADAFDEGEVELLKEAAADLAYGIGRLRDRNRSREADEIEDLYNHAPCGYHSLDAEGTVTRINDTELAWLGYRRDEIVDRVKITDLLTAESRERFPDRFLHLKESGWIHDLELELLRRDGSRLPVLVSATAIRAADGRYVSSRCTLYDITDRKRAEAALRMAKEAAEEATRVKSEFLANMSHELRTPLNAIIGFSEVLRDGLLGEMAPAQREYVADIFDGGQHLLALINDILDLSKIEAGRMSLELEPAAPAEFLRNSLAIVKEKAAAHRIRLALDAAPDLGMTLLDARKTKQIVYNLLANAVKFTPDGGSVTLRMRKVGRGEVESFRSAAPTQRRLPLPDGQARDFLEIAVEDTGIGIAPEQAARLFRPFSQLDSSLDREHEGTGLGLVLVSRLTQLHGGTVAVSSSPGHGSAFTVWLPWRHAEGERPHPAPSPSLPADDRRQALVVEDNMQAADLIQTQLQAEGFAVVRAASAEEGLNLSDSLQPSVIILDILLPGMDGWDFLTRIKQPGTPWAQVPVVIVSVVADSQRGFSLGAAAVLQKPVSRDELAAALHQLYFPAGNCQECKILIVDDDPKAVELLAAYLASPGYTVLKAHGGLEGIDITRRELPDLIVLDLMMPEVSGFDVVEALRADPRTAAVPIIVVTARQSSREDRQALNGSVSAILEKASFNHGRFSAEVRRALLTRKGVRS